MDPSSLTEVNATSWIDRLAPDEFALLDAFERQMVLDELSWRRRRTEQLLQENSVTTAGALLVVGSVRFDAVRTYAVIASLEQAARSFNGSALADEIARALAPRLRALARPVVVPPDDAFVDQDAGLFDREVYLRLARKDVFDNRKIGKKRVARWGDVKSALAKAGAQVKLAESTDDPEADLLNEIRLRAGLAVKGGR